MAIYSALIADIVGSKELASRNSFQQRFLKAVNEELNQSLRKDTAAGFIVTAGDEFQGLLTNPAPLVAVIRHLFYGLHPVRLRYGLGLGTLSTDLQPQAIGMDGPAFYRARSAIETVTGGGVAINSGNEALDGELSNHLSLLESVRWRWTDRQRQVTLLYYQHRNQEKVAQELGITQPAVHKHLEASRLNLVMDSEASLEGILAGLS